MQTICRQFPKVIHYSVMGSTLTTLHLLLNTREHKSAYAASYLALLIIKKMTHHLVCFK